MRKTLLVGASAAIVAIGALAFADNHATDAQKMAAVEARIAQMKGYGAAMGALGKIAKGEMAFTTASATAAADKLLASAMSQDPKAVWIPGTSSDDNAVSRANAAIWADGSDFNAKGGAFFEAAKAVQAAAGTDLAGFQAAMGTLGGTCGDCHKVYRGPKR